MQAAAAAALAAAAIFLAHGAAHASVSPEDARALLLSGDFEAAIAEIDAALEADAGNVALLHYKGVAEGNAGRHSASLETFRAALAIDPRDAVALAGSGVGFGNLGEYHEAREYFVRALGADAGNATYQNYIEHIDRIIAKYPVTSTEKPDAPLLQPQRTAVPSWYGGVAAAWARGELSGDAFAAATDYLLGERVLQVPDADPGRPLSESIPDSDTVERWRAGDVSRESLVHVVQDMVRGGLVKNPPQDPRLAEQAELAERLWFRSYLNRIENDIRDELRYIEFPNPSADVIKKFMRDYVKWNFDQEVREAALRFPAPGAYELADGSIELRYSMYVNVQPPGLPLDHVGTLAESISFWEGTTVEIAGTPARVSIDETGAKSDANVWITWVVRDLGEGVLGHANLGRGVVEVALGDHACDGSFQLYDVDTVKRVMTHELGHSIGLLHSDDPSDIMYPMLAHDYAYCLI